MGSQLTAYISTVGLSGVLTTFLGIYAYLHRREIPAGRTFVIYLAVQAIYIFAYCFELTSDSLEVLKQWITVQYVGIAFAPVLGLLFICKYIDLAVPRKIMLLLFVIPTITFIMVATNDAHHLFYKSIEWQDNTPFVSASEITIGEWYIVHGVYTSSCLFASTLLLISRWRRTKKAYRKQLIILIFSYMLPMVSAFIYLIGLTPGGIDPVPFILCLTSALYWWAIVTMRLLTVVPITKESLFESMKEGVIVLDRFYRLIDFNAAVRKMLPVLSSDMIGRPLDEVWTQLTGAPFPVVNDQRNAQEVSIETPGQQPLWCQARFSQVQGRSGLPIGSMLMLIDMTTQKQLQQQLEQLAYFDGLTGIYNRAQFIVRGKQLLNNSLTEQKPLSLVLFDIDSFKRINDTYGHDIGDEAIVHTVSMCRLRLTPDCLFARYGGEEFVIAAPDLSLDQAAQLAEQIRAQLADSPLAVGNTTLHITSSFGVVQSRSAEDTLEVLLRDADSALYEAKRTGKNNVCVFSGN